MPIYKIPKTYVSTLSFGKMSGALDKRFAIHHVQRTTHAIKTANTATLSPAKAANTTVLSAFQKDCPCAEPKKAIKQQIDALVTKISEIKAKLHKNERLLIRYQTNVFLKNDPKTESKIATIKQQIIEQQKEKNQLQSEHDALKTQLSALEEKKQPAIDEKTTQTPPSQKLPSIQTPVIKPESSQLFADKPQSIEKPKNITNPQKEVPEKLKIKEYSLIDTLASWDLEKLRETQHCIVENKQKIETLIQTRHQELCNADLTVLALKKEQQQITKEIEAIYTEQAEILKPESAKKPYELYTIAEEPKLKEIDIPETLINRLAEIERKLHHAPIEKLIINQEIADLEQKLEQHHYDLDLLSVFESSAASNAAKLDLPNLPNPCQLLFQHLLENHDVQAEADIGYYDLNPTQSENAHYQDLIKAVEHWKSIYANLQSDKKQLIEKRAEYTEKLEYVKKLQINYPENQNDQYVLETQEQLNELLAITTQHIQETSTKLVQTTGELYKARAELSFHKVKMLPENRYEVFSEFLSLQQKIASEKLELLNEEIAQIRPSIRKVFDAIKSDDPNIEAKLKPWKLLDTQLNKSLKYRTDMLALFNQNLIKVNESFKDIQSQEKPADKARKAMLEESFEKNKQRFNTFVTFFKDTKQLAPEQQEARAIEAAQRFPLSSLPESSRIKFDGSPSDDALAKDDLASLTDKVDDSASPTAARLKFRVIE